MSIYGITKQYFGSFDEAVLKIKEALSKEGFGILSEINVQEKMKEKLGKDMNRYIILGACNPPLAFDALQKEQEIGLLLPCNVIVYEKNGNVYVSALKPSVALSITDNPALTDLASKAEEKLTTAINSL